VHCYSKQEAVGNDRFFYFSLAPKRTATGNRTARTGADLQKNGKSAWRGTNQSFLICEKLHTSSSANLSRNLIAAGGGWSDERTSKPRRRGAILKSHTFLPRTTWNAFACSAILVALMPGALPAQQLPGIATGPQQGALVICGGGNLPESIRRKVIELAGGERARMVIITTASQTADSPDVEIYLSWWRQQPLADLSILHTRSREVANDPKFVEPLTHATGVWFLGGNQAPLIDTYSGTLTEKELFKLLNRGGVISGTSAGAAVMSKVMIRGGNNLAEVGKGFGFLDGAIIDQHFVRRQRQNRLLHVVEQHPGHFGLGIDEGTAIVVQGQRVSVLGESEVRVCFARTDSRDPLVESLREGDSAELSALSRIAMARKEPKKIGPQGIPELSDGMLVIVGGDTVPEEAMERFVAAAGSDDETTVALFSFDGADSQAVEAALMENLRKAGVKNVQRVDVTSRQQADDPELRKILNAAKGIWMCGARPQKCVETCLGTVAEQICREVLRRGGVVGGAGAAGMMQGELLVNASPVPTKRILMDGYDRGFGFLPGVAIALGTQSSEDSPKPLDLLRQEHPQVVGLDIEDSTALIVQGHTLEVVGKKQVAVFDGVADNSLATPEVLQAGDRYNFKERSRIARKESE
jgi:cyanophycinase